MNRIVLNDGTEIPDGSIVISGENQVLASVPGTDLAGAVSLFGDPEKTQEMTCYFSVFCRVYKGYTMISSVGIDRRDDRTQVYLTGTDTSMEESYTVDENYLPRDMRKGDNK